MFGRKSGVSAVLEREKKTKSEPEKTETLDSTSEGVLNLSLETPKQLKKRLNLLSLFVLGAAALGATNLLLTLGVLIFNVKVATNNTPTLVELADGTSVRVQGIASDERSPEAITEFTASTLVKLFDWRGNLPASKAEEMGAPAPDPGVDIGGAKVTTSTWAASFAVSESFRTAFLKGIAALTPSSLFGDATARTQGVLVIRNIGKPQKVAPGKWSIDVVANLILFESGNNVGKATPFNKTVVVDAIAPPKYPNNPTDLQRTIYEARKAGLEIESMRDLQI